MMKGLFGVTLAGLVILASCAPVGPTPRPTHTILPEIAASPTVDPLLPTYNPYGAPGQNSPDAAAVPSGMNVEGVTPLPAQAAFEVVARSDGLRMQGTLYSAAEEPAPAVLMLPQLGGRKEDWLPLVTPLQEAGYTVLAMDLRGQGTTGGRADWTAAIEDVADMLAALRAIPGVDAGRVGVIGASIGANLGLVGCAADPLCSAAVLLSPGLDYQGVLTEGAAVQMDERPLLIIASQGDAYSADSGQRLDALAPGPHELMITEGTAHGTRLLVAPDSLPGTILAWLQRSL
jgi:pimeloyl-ACP methyl ester carboxylesterase